MRMRTLRDIMPVFVDTYRFAEYKQHDLLASTIRNASSRQVILMQQKQAAGQTTMFRLIRLPS